MTSLHPYACPTCGRDVKPEHGDYSVSVYCRNCLDVDYVGEEFKTIGLQASIAVHEAPSWEACEAKAIEAWNETVLDYICRKWYARFEVKP